MNKSLNYLQLPHRSEKARSFLWIF